MRSKFLGPVSEVTRSRACRLLGHEDPVAFGLGGCALPDDDLVQQLCDRVEELTHRLAQQGQESR
jgi:hypothetical protein